MYLCEASCLLERAGAKASGVRCRDFCLRGSAVVNETDKDRDVLDICRDHVTLWKMSVAMVVLTRSSIAAKSRWSTNREGH